VEAEEDQARAVGDIVQERNLQLAVAESLTGGMLASRFARAPAASQWFRGGVVAYSSSVKFDLLDVPEGPVVSEQSAAAMAAAARLLGAGVGLSVTGVGGPEPQDGEPPGTVWVSTWPPELGDPIQLHLHGSPESVCEQVCREATRLLHDRLRSWPPPESDRSPGAPAPHR
jgi:nicotinamide-nucleotide amidase